MMVVAASTGHARCHHAQASKACEEECNKLEFQVVLIGSRSDLSQEKAQIKSEALPG